MAEGKTNLFGKTYNTIGSTDSNFLIKTKGDLKVQWGGKYIDVIKNGKIAHSQEKFIQLVESEEDIKGTGIYITPENKIFISIDGTIIDISAVSENTYVSFLEEQQVDDKTIALRNIGFYYESLEKAQSQKIISGIVFIENENCLYLIKDGTYTKYSGTYSMSSTTDVKDLFLYIEENSLFVNGMQYIECNHNQVTIYKRVELKDGIQSEHANQDRGFRLYMFEGKSYLEIDYIKQRVKETTEKVQHFPLYSQKDNLVQELSFSDDKSQVSITLQKPNKYLIGEYIYVVIQQELYEYEILNSEGQTISIQIDPGIAQSFLDYCYNIYLSRSPYIHIEKGDLKVLDRSITIENNGIVQDDYPHILIGQVIEEQLKIPEKNVERPKVGIYSDNFIGVNPKLYNPIFKGTDYPKYDNSLEIPNNINDSSYNQVMPNLEWVQALISQIIPKGTIVMWSGTDIPEGWAICNGENGTPNLIGKFIKASDTAGEFGGNNNITLSSDNLPSHQHTITNINTLESGDNSHSHTVPGQQLLGSILATNTILNWQSKSSNPEEQQDIQVLKGITLNELNEGDIYLDISQNQEEIEFEIQEQDSITSEETEDPHTHSIDSIITDDNDTQIKEINIQPEYYSLIFIIKQ